MIGQARAATRAVERFLALPFVRLRVPPNALTLFTVVPAGFAAFLAAERQYLWALLPGAVAAGLDVVDGTVARLRGLQTRFGGYLDSVVDRWVDFLFLFGLAWSVGDGRTWAAFAFGLLGTFGTSYAKARAYEAFEAPKEAWGQLFERGERIILLGAGTLTQGLLDLWGQGVDVLFWFLAVYAVGSNLTMLQRVWKVRRLLDPLDSRDRD